MPTRLIPQRQKIKRCGILKQVIQSNCCCGW